ncbi:hypothetical protein [Streptomyces sp. B1I3]|uniref:hypothetical protein n=1 Tax=Streptomyces sp. B1I3 TaxID=3042264 RepID=UPI0027878E6A|nr:hypothetical protein [Streptomyces sp. B1I3]MDQ0792054.1 hypothetical protein [Streptomyces sp. B1I3]
MSLISARARQPKHRGTGRKRAKEQTENQQLLRQVGGAIEYIGQLEIVNACLEATAMKVTVQRDRSWARANALQAELARVNGLLAPYLAAEANAGAVTVPGAERDTTAIEDQATAPIDVKPLWEAHGISPVIRVADAPSADDPRTPTWVPSPDSETTQTLRVVAA